MQPNEKITGKLFTHEHFNPSAQGNNCGFHCVAHRLFGELLQMPVNQQQEFYTAHQTACNNLMEIFAKHYQIKHQLDQTPKTFEDFQQFLTTINKFNNPIELEILMGEVLRSYFNAEKERLGLIDSIETSLNDVNAEIKASNRDKEKILATIIQAITNIDTETQKPQVKAYPAVNGMFASIKEALKAAARKYMPEAIAKNSIFDSIITKQTKRVSGALQQVKGRLLFNKPGVAKGPQGKNTKPNDKSKHR